MTFDHAAVLAEYDAQVRRGTGPGGSGAVAERAGPVVRWKSVGGGGWSARGCRYLQVDASPDSRPILERLGFARLAMTTPYTWSPG